MRKAIKNKICTIQDIYTYCKLSQLKIKDLTTTMCADMDMRKCTCVPSQSISTLIILRIYTALKCKTILKQRCAKPSTLPETITKKSLSLLQIPTLLLSVYFVNN